MIIETQMGVLWKKPILKKMTDECSIDIQFYPQYTLYKHNKLYEILIGYAEI